MKTICGWLLILLGCGGLGYLMDKWDGVGFVYKFLLIVFLIIVGVGLLSK